MEKTIKIPMKGFSINAMFGRNKSFTTTAYKEWAATIFYKSETQENLEAFEELREFFDEKKHGYEVELTHYFPKEILFTKKGILSAKAFDLSNIEKPLIDLLFLPKYFKKPSPYGIKNLNIDDKFIYTLISKKRPSDAFSIEIKFKIIEL